MGSPNPLFLSHGSTVQLSALWMSETMAVAMVMSHCNVSLPTRRCLQQLPSWGKRRRRGGEEERGGLTRGEGSAAASTRMLINLSRQFVLHYAGDNARDNKRERLCVTVNTGIRTKAFPCMSGHIYSACTQDETNIQGHTYTHKVQQTKKRKNI